MIEIDSALLERIKREWSAGHDPMEPRKIWIKAKEFERDSSMSLDTLIATLQHIKDYVLPQEHVASAEVAWDDTLTISYARLRTDEEVRQEINSIKQHFAIKDAKVMREFEELKKNTSSS